MKNKILLFCADVIVKKSNLFIFLFLVFQSASYSQTTEAEYNYLTKGYKAQVMDQGGDLKQGYKLQTVNNAELGDYQFNLYSFTRDVDGSLAGLLVWAKSEVSGKAYYLCIPIQNSELTQRYAKDIMAWDETMTSAYCVLFTSYLGELLSNAK